MRHLYSVDIKKCDKITSDKEISAILKSISINNKSVKLKNMLSSRGDAKYVIGEISTIKFPDYFILTKRKIDFELSRGASYEFFIENKSTAYFFISRIASIEKTLKIGFPSEIFRINRRENLRYTPSSEYPIRIEYFLDKVSYEDYVNDISGGGCSIAVNDDRLRLGGKISGLKIHYGNETIKDIRAEIVHVRSKRFPSGEYSLYGLKFVGLSSRTSKQITKNIFMEYRSFLDYLEKRIV